MVFGVAFRIKKRSIMFSVSSEDNQLVQILENPLLSLREKLLKRYKIVRGITEKLCEKLETEDYVIQSMPDVSPAKWHLAHTSWFFETFLLANWDDEYKTPNVLYNFLFNSYYVKVGDRFNRPERGLLSRPTVKEVYAYRKHVDDNMFRFFTEAYDEVLEKYSAVIEIGLNHEQQHQELMLTDIKHVFSQNPLYPSLVKYQANKLKAGKLEWLTINGGLTEFGHNRDGFFYDNEKPLHKRYIENFKVASRLITNGEYLEFMEDDGYKRAELWLSNGFAAVEKNKWNSPLYWYKEERGWYNYTLGGYRKVDINEPVSHVSYYEADAFARWAGARLLTEFEWEEVSKNIELTGNFVETGKFHPSINPDKGLTQMYGDLWEWTMSDYAPYPGYKIPEGAIGEYNGKFMSDQYVLRGGSCATSISHIRNTYRNFFPPDARWQYSGIRLARDME